MRAALVAGSAVGCPVGCPGVGDAAGAAGASGLGDGGGWGSTSNIQYQQVFPPRNRITYLPN